MHLLPPDDKPVRMKQGKTPDCFLLAALDCILHSKEGRGYISDMFTERSDGSLELRIHRSNDKYFPNLQGEGVRRKYDYYYDNSRGEDVFVLKKEHFREFLQFEGKGVVTNAMAVLILEHIIPYYFDRPFTEKASLNSIVAYSHEARQSDLEEDEFVADVLNLGVIAFQQEKKLIKYLSMNQDDQVYIALDWGEADSHGMVHARHALRVKHVHRLDNGEREYILINPWDNSGEIKMLGSELKAKSPRMGVYHPDKSMTDLYKVLLEQPSGVGKLVLASPECKELLKQPVFLDRLEDKGADEVIFRVLDVVKANHGVSKWFNQLSTQEQKEAMFIILEETNNAELIANIEKRFDKKTPWKDMPDKEPATKPRKQCSIDFSQYREDLDFKTTRAMIADYLTREAKNLKDDGWITKPCGEGNLSIGRSDVDESLAIKVDIDFGGKYQAQLIGRNRFIISKLPDQEVVIDISEQTEVLKVLSRMVKQLGMIDELDDVRQSETATMVDDFMDKETSLEDEKNVSPSHPGEVTSDYRAKQQALRHQLEENDNRLEETTSTRKGF